MTPFTDGYNNELTVPLFCESVPQNRDPELTALIVAVPLSSCMSCLKFAPSWFRPSYTKELRAVTGVFCEGFKQKQAEHSSTLTVLPAY